MFLNRKENAKPLTLREKVLKDIKEDLKLKELKSFNKKLEDMKTLFSEGLA